MVIPCLCLSRFSSCTVHHKTAVIPVDIPMRWEPRTNQSNGLRLLIFLQPLGRALKNQNAAPTTPPCFSRWLRSSSLHWGFDCLRCARHVLFESCTVRLRRGLVDEATKKPLTKVRGSCFGGALSTALEPKTSSREMVLESSVKLKLSTTRSSKT